MLVIQIVYADGTIHTVGRTTRADTMIYVRDELSRRGYAVVVDVEDVLR